MVIMNSLWFVLLVVSIVWGTERDTITLIKTPVGLRLCERYCNLISFCFSFEVNSSDLKCQLKLNKAKCMERKKKEDMPCSNETLCTKLLTTRKGHICCVPCFQRETKSKPLHEINYVYSSLMISHFNTAKSTTDFMEYGIPDGPMKPYPFIGKHIGNIKSMVFVRKSRSILFSEEARNGIRSHKLYMRNSVNELLPGMSGESMVVDDHLLFFIYGSHVYRASASHKNVGSDITDTNIRFCSALVIDPENKTLFILQSIPRRKSILSISYNGGNRKTVHKRFSLRSLAIDYTRSFLFLHTRKRVVLFDLSINKSRNFKTRNTKKISQMVYYNDTLYIGDSSSVNLRIFNTTDRREKEPYNVRRNLAGSKIMCLFQ